LERRPFFAPDRRDAGRDPVERAGEERTAPPRVPDALLRRLAELARVPDAAPRPAWAPLLRDDA
jgi:hypothetical protein